MAKSRRRLFFQHSTATCSVAQWRMYKEVALFLFGRDRLVMLKITVRVVDMLGRAEELKDSKLANTAN